MLDRIAAELYTTASMMVGAGEDSVRLVEYTAKTAEVTPGRRCGFCAARQPEGAGAGGD